MSVPRRIARLQRYLNDEHDLAVEVDGRLGLETLGALEVALDIEDWAVRDREPVDTRTVFDERTERNLATLDPLALPTLRRLVALAMEVADEEDVVVKVISGHRTWAEQDRLYALGRTAPGTIRTRARGGYSNHNFGIAIDFGVFRGGSYLDHTEPDRAREIHALIAARARERGLDTEWGGDWPSFPDPPHHELRSGLTLAEKRDRYLRSATVLT